MASFGDLHPKDFVKIPLARLRFLIREKLMRQVIPIRMKINTGSPNVPV
jgi:hypothetical protein